MDAVKEIKLLKKTVMALAQLNLCYRIGKPKVPAWVFDALDKANAQYDHDLLHIK